MKNYVYTASNKVRAHYQVSEDADATEETADSDKSAGKDVE